MDTDKHGFLVRHIRWRIVIGLLCFLIGYVLSIGPAIKLEDNGILGKRTDKVLNVLYTPLQTFVLIPGVRQFFGWYIFHVWKCDTMGDNTI
jgi:hypothetical protein